MYLTQFLTMCVISELIESRPKERFHRLNCSIAVFLPIFVHLNVKVGTRVSKNILIP